MATGASIVRARRNASLASYLSGFYRSLNSSPSTTTSDGVASALVPVRKPDLRLPQGSELPSGCFLVERIIAMRKYKVSLVGTCTALCILTNLDKFLMCCCRKHSSI